MNKSAMIINEVKKAIVGKDQTLIRVYLAILAGGHILLEDIPGVGKTTMALAFSKALGLEYSRVQFTPDVLPSDIVGFSVYNKDSGAFEYRRGAVFSNLFLADELNRATSRTQSALLQAMEEESVTVDGTTHELPKPFTVIATQNPAGAAGTQLLPDSQLDRFMVRLSLGFPSFDSEKDIVRRRQSGSPLLGVCEVVSREELEAMKAAAAKTYIADSIVDYIVRLVTATRQSEHILQGASPRASLALAAIAKASAYVQGRAYCVPDDVRLFFTECVAHRLRLAPECLAPDRGAAWALGQISAAVAPPQISDCK